MVSSIAICSTSSRAAAACDLDSSPNANGARPSSSHSSRGGLSFLFANNKHSEPMESRRGSDPLSANDVLSGSAKVRDHNSPVSVLQLPGSPHRFSLPTHPLIRREGFGICPAPQSIRTLPSSSPEEALNPAFFQPSTPRKTVGEELAFSSDMGGPLHPEAAQKDPAMSLSELFCQPLFPHSMESSQDILRDAQSRHEIFNDPLIIQAFKEADEAHHGQMRANGDPYIVHCVETAMILATVGASKVVVAAGLLHDTIDDSTIDYEEIQDLFGVDVADLVEGVSRLSEFSKLARDNNTASKRVEADRLHTMFLAMADVQVVLIKLADRLHNMRTLDALPHHKQWRMAKETLEVFVPLANRLGIWSWKAGLEDLCFKHLKPKEYQELKRKLSHGFREATLLSSIQKLDEALKRNGVMYYDLCGRPKNLYSIYKKIVRKGTNINEVWDVRGLRLIVAREEDCFTVLKIVHGLWPQDPEQYRDYISKPKLNGYQSLHTVVFADDGLPLEVQIRSKEMHQQAEFGVAAHWRYKEGDTKHSSFVLQMVEWARWVLTWKNEIMDTKLRLSPLGADLRPPCPFLSHVEGCPDAGIDTDSLLNRHGDEPIYVLVLEDDKMVVQELPEGSTVAELLYRRSDDEYFPAYSSWDEGPRLSVNHRIVSDLNQKLKMGDLVEMKPCISELSLKEYMEKCMLDETKSESTEEQGARNSLARPVMML